MKWSEVLDEVAERSGESKAATRRVLEAFVQLTVERVVAGDRVAIPKLGSLQRSWRKPSILRRVDSGLRMALDGRWVARFRPSTTLRDGLLEQSPQPLLDPAHQKAWRVASALLSDLEAYHGAEVRGALTQAANGDAEAALRGALGATWTRCRETYASRVDTTAVRDRDHLLEQAVARWGSAP